MLIEDHKPRKLRRWREPLAKHIAKISEHLTRFIMAKGSCNHFTRMDEDLMDFTIILKKQLDEYRAEYERWIRDNVTKNPERFLP